MDAHGLDLEIAGWMERKSEREVSWRRLGSEGKAWVVRGVCKGCGFFISSAGLLIMDTNQFQT